MKLDDYVSGLEQDDILVKFLHVRRAHNQTADSLAKRAASIWWAVTDTKWGYELDSFVLFGLMEGKMLLNYGGLPLAVNYMLSMTTLFWYIVWYFYKL